MNKKTKSRIANLERVTTRLIQAQDLISELLDNPDKPINVNDTPFGGVCLLEQLGIIEIFDNDTRTAMDDEGKQKPLMMAITLS